MEKNTGLVLEGGAMRSIFTAGVLDALMEEKMQFPNVYAVSAGAFAGMHYISNQYGICRKAMIDSLYEYQYLGPKVFFKKGTFFDMDYLFDVILPEVSKFDFDAFKKYPGRFITSTVDCNTGEIHYFSEFESMERLSSVMKAANSMPIIARITEIDGMPMLDGGMRDAIPIMKALEDGMEKIVAVLTRDPSYRKSEKKALDQRITEVLYRKYPKFLEMLQTRWKRYNDSLEVIENMEKEGKAFVFRTYDKNFKNGESDPDRLNEYYRYGLEEARSRMGELKKFLDGDVDKQ